MQGRPFLFSIPFRHRARGPLVPTLGLLLCLVLTALPLLAADAESKFDPKADFGSIQTYAWRLQEVRFPPAGSEGDLKIIEAVDEQLADEGFNEVRGEGATPDVYVTYYAVVEDKLEVLGSEYELGSWVTWSDTGGTQVRSYKEGTLVIDIVDAESKKLMWSGWIQGVAIDADDLRRKVPRAVRRIFRQFPPEAE